MTNSNSLILLASAAIVLGCATVAPKELVDAREGYDRASHGNAADAAPAEVHVAHKALTKAERSFDENGDTYRTRDLAYVAHRKAQLAEATAAIASQQGKQARADDDYSDAQGEIVDETRKALSDSEERGARTEVELAAEKKARADADRRASDALAKLAAVRSDDRGMIITLSGSVLFASNKSTLLPAARSRLEQVADVLLEEPDRDLRIEGHTDSKGSDDYNRRLSQQRADAVRSALVGRGYPSEHIQTEGMGETQPVGDNTSSEGRANNRRVEIVVARQ
jgi:outer membrane protein OmpA-like peptidoglycan-associated protein